MCMQLPIRDYVVEIISCNDDGIEGRWSFFGKDSDDSRMQCLKSVLRRISCHGRNHSQASCEYSLTIFLCCQHHSEYSLLGSKFSTNLLFTVSKCHTSQYSNMAVRDVQNGRTGWDRCSGEALLAPCTRKKRLQRKITKHYHWVSVQENIGMFSKS